MQEAGNGKDARLRLGPANAAVPSIEETPAVYLPIWALTDGHVGCKVRIEGRVLAFDVSTAHLLLASASDPHHPQAPIKTVLVNTRIALSGQSPAALDVASARDGVDPRHLGRPSWEKRYEAPRLSFDRGSWVTVVGWLEPEAAFRTRKSVAEGPYAPPLNAILDAIHLVGRSAPPSDAVHQAEAR